jgi:uncharacterized membrane protein YgdD (TMEM256/DUF423 family)
MSRTFAIIGAIFAFLGVALGAFGAHALAAHFAANPDLEPPFETAARYQMYHALALFIVAWLAERYSDRLMRWAGWLFTLGIILFSGSLYILSIFNVRIMGAVAPLGGASFLAAWACVAWTLWRDKSAA